MRNHSNNISQVIKPIFFSPTYLESSIAYCDLCFALIDFENDVVYECQLCANFAICLGCLKQRTHRLFSHPVDHQYFPCKPPAHRDWKNRHLHVTCDECGEKNFLGKRYQCRQCFDYNLCSKCFPHAQDNHFPSEQHVFTYTPNPTKLCHNHALLADRALKILQHRNATPTERDEITGWTLEEAQQNLKDAINNCSVAWSETKRILDDEDINYKPNIIENEKIKSTLVYVN